jgi:DNA (cytosine-5)-methyltransferase 1
LNKKIVHGHFLEGTSLANKKKTGDIARLYEDYPAKTLKKKNKMHHYNQTDKNLNRFLTILEYKRLQSFPDNLELQGTISEMRDQIGNAVPCKFAQAIGRTVREAYSSGKYIPRED